MHKPITENDLDNWFTYHAPLEEQKAMYESIRGSAHCLAHTILTTTPAGPDQSAAIRKIREAVMTANAAIACRKWEVCPDCKGEGFRQTPGRFGMMACQRCDGNRIVPMPTGEAQRTSPDDAGKEK